MKLHSALCVLDLAAALAAPVLSQNTGQAVALESGGRACASHLAAGPGMRTGG